MNTSRRFTLLALFALLSATNVFATLWTGTITQTITSTDSVEYYVGQTFEGFYAYDSDARDGFYDIYGSTPLNPDRKQGNLRGVLFFFDMGYKDFGTVGHVTNMYLEVINGEVTDFHKGGKTGASEYGFDESTFGYYYGGTRTGFAVHGTMTFGSAHEVPDASPTAVLFGLALTGLFIKARSGRDGRVLQSRLPRQQRHCAIASLFALLFFTTAHATQWQGTITQTITESNNPLFQAGESYLGNYSYENDVSDGLFVPVWYSNYNFTGEATNLSLKASLFMFDIGLIPLTEGSFLATTEMTVQNGEAVSFFKEGQSGFADFWFDDFKFDYRYRKNADIRIQGTLAFSAPQQVPEATNTAMLFAIGIIVVVGASAVYKRNGRGIVIAFLGLLSFSQSFATVWRGSITQTITQSNTALYQVGQSYEGFYTYEYDERDGFFVNWLIGQDPEEVQAHMYASLFMFDLGWRTTGLGQTMWNKLVVENGEVTEFYHTGQTAFGGFTFQDFNWGYSWGDHTNKEIGGTLTFGTSQEYQVPETVGTAALFGLSLVVILAANKGRAGRGSMPA